MAIGAGGLIGGLMFPGLDERLAQHITPNPNPLAQQGGPPNPKAVDSLGNPVPTQPQQNLAPAAVTQPDPVNASYAADLLKAARRDEMGQGINLGLDRIAAGFGTREQQASKQQGIARAQGVGGGLADLMGIQKMQDQTIQDNEHARFMANARVFGDTLRGQGINVTDAQATEIMNNPGLLERFGAAAGGNATLTGTTKDADQATESYKAAHPNATPQEIADFRASVISMASGGGNIEDQQYRAYALAERAAGREPLDKLAWVAQHAQDAKETEDAHKTALQLPGLKSQLTTMEQTADSINADAIKGIFGNVSKQDAARQIFNYDPSKGGMDPATLYGDGRTLSREETNAIIAARKLHLANYAANFKEAGSGQRLSQAEAARLGASSDTLGNFSGTVDDYMERVGDVKKKIGHAMTNAHGEARDLDSLPVQYRPKIDPSFIEGPNALKNLPKWAQPAVVNDEKDFEALPYGQAYKPASGKYAGKILFKGQESGYEDY
jgi:hypothetical protein